MILDRILNRQALAMREREPDKRLMIVVGATYPSMFGYDPAMLTVTRIYKFNGDIQVEFTVVKTDIPEFGHSNSLGDFCKGIAKRIAREHNIVQSVDVTEYFHKLGLAGGKSGGLI